MFGQANGPILQKLHSSMHKFNPIVRLRGIILVNTKDNC